jgi:hypothetical protein
MGSRDKLSGGRALGIEATCSEDRAFRVSLTIAYGEGQRAFPRLLDAISAKTLVWRVRVVRETFRRLFLSLPYLHHTPGSRQIRGRIDLGCGASPLLHTDCH